jgi:hypothetical protein
MDDRAKWSNDHVIHTFSDSIQSLDNFFVLIYSNLDEIFGFIRGKAPKQTNILIHIAFICVD